jgi:hypothetical protein
MKRNKRVRRKEKGKGATKEHGKSETDRHTCRPTDRKTVKGSTFDEELGYGGQICFCIDRERERRRWSKITFGRHQSIKRERERERE